MGIPANSQATVACKGRGESRDRTDSRRRVILMTGSDARPVSRRPPGRGRGLPTRLVVDDKVVHIDSFPLGDDTVLITRGDQDIFSLPVVPPDTAPEAAHAVMAQAVRADNVTRATQILVDTASAQVPPD
ncbi:DUF5994 family protein [Streptomyces sp. NPDC001056]